MTENVTRAPIAVGAICVCCKKTFHYYIWQARGMNKSSSNFEIPKMPVCRNCRSRAVETDIRKTHVRGG